MADRVRLVLSILCAVLSLQVLLVRTAHDPNEQERFYFFYSPKTSMFFVTSFTHTTMNCYLVALTENEKLSVHTDEGLRAIEVKSLSNIVTAVPASAEDLDPRDVKLCHNLQHNRTVYFYKVV